MAGPISDEEVRSRVLARLNDLYEQKFYESIDADEFCKEFSFSRQEFKSVLNPLYVKGLVENEIEGAPGNFTVRLTLSGKEAYDKASDNTQNGRVREKLLDFLAAEYGKNADARTDSETLVKELGLDRNTVCLNLLIMEKHDLVSLEEGYGVGHSYYYVSLTPEGKYAHDNPKPNLVFLSHAAADEEMARHLKQVIETCFPGLDVFVSSDPEDLPPGNPWVRTVLEKLSEAKLLLVLATERGLSRKWVWFETGAGWSRDLLFIPCCVGKARKGELPHPFSGYQALNIDEEGDFGSLMNELKKRFGAPEKALDLRSVIAELARLDIRAEEREKARAARITTAVDQAAIQALIMELEDNSNAAVRFQIDRIYVAPSNTEWLKYRTSLSTLPNDLRAELNTTYQKIREWKGIVDSGVNPGIGSMEIPKICKKLRSELPPLIGSLKELLGK